MKYIVFDDNGIEDVVLFSVLRQHNDVARQMNLTVISAGFCNPDTDTTEYDYSIVPNWSVWGESVSLKVKSRPTDAKLIVKMVNFRA